MKDMSARYNGERPAGRNVAVVVREAPGTRYCERRSRFDRTYAVPDL
jgi:hypothetical protein